MFKGEAKKNYQREYMRRRRHPNSDGSPEPLAGLTDRSNSGGEGLTKPTSDGSNVGLTKEVGLTEGSNEKKLPIDKDPNYIFYGGRYIKKC